MSRDSSTESERHVSTDRESIQRWADEHDVVPVRSAEGSRRLQLVSESAVGADEDRLDWDTFYDELAESEHAVIYHGEHADQAFEVTTHEDAVARTDMDDQQVRARLIEGETVTSTIEETTVVETVVVEEATVESELVGTETVEETVVETELLSRECTGCQIVTDQAADDPAWFDTDRYFASLENTRAGTTQGAEIGQTSVDRQFPYSAEFDIEESWAVTREYTERMTVESTITETDITDAETIEDYQIDVEGLQRSIVEQGLLGVDQPPADIISDCEIHSELTEGDRIHTHFERTQVVEDDVVDHLHAYADIASADMTQMQITNEEDLATEMTGGGGLEGTEETVVAGEASISLTQDDVGKQVVDASGDQVGKVDDVPEGGQVAYVTPHSGITERIMSALDWGDKEERDKEIYAGQIAAITDGEVRLKEHEHLSEHRESSRRD